MQNLNLIQGLPHNPPQIPELFSVPQQMMQVMRPLSGFLMHELQTAAMQGNGDFKTMFWAQCVNNGFNNPYYREVLQHAAALVYGQFMATNGNVGQNVIPEVAHIVAINYPIQWAFQTNPQLAQSLDINTQNQLRMSMADYSQKVNTALQVLQNGLNGNMNQWSGFNNGMGGNTGWNNNGFGGQPGLSPQQLMALQSGGNNMWGQSNQQQGGWFGNQQQGMGFNSQAWGNQMNNNAFQNTGGSNWQFNNGQQNDNILTAGKVSGFEAPAVGNGGGNGMSQQDQLNAVWNVGSNQTQQSQQPTGDLTWGSNISTTPNATNNGNGNGFAPVNVGNNGSLDAMVNSADKINQNIATAPLQTFGNQEGGMTAPVVVTAPTVNEKRTVINPKNPSVKINMVGGHVQRHLKFFDPDKQYTVCEVINDKVIKQEIRNKEVDNMDFADQNTARFIAAKGTPASKIDETDGLTLAETASRALHYSYLDTALQQIADESTAETLTNDDIAIGLARISDERIIRLDDMIDAPFNTPLNNFEYYLNQRGVNAVFKKSIIAGDIIQLDNSNLTDDVCQMFDDLREGELTVSKLTWGFNRLRPIIGEHLWTRLNNEITIWLNEELYVNYGLSLAITDFSVQFEELTDLMSDDKFGFTWEEIQRLINNITIKFLNVYRHDHPSAVNIYTEANGYSDENPVNLLGIIQRYVMLPLYSKDLVISSNSTSGIITAANQPELYSIISTTMPNLLAANDVIARNFLVTLNGDQILVTKPDGMSQFILTRKEGGLIKNPLL